MAQLDTVIGGDGWGTRTKNTGGGDDVDVRNIGVIDYDDDQGQIARKLQWYIDHKKESLVSYKLLNERTDFLRKDGEGQFFLNDQGEYAVVGSAITVSYNVILTQIPMGEGVTYAFDDDFSIRLYWIDGVSGEDLIVAPFTIRLEKLGSDNFRLTTSPATLTNPAPATVGIQFIFNRGTFNSTFVKNYTKISNLNLLQGIAAGGSNTLELVHLDSGTDLLATNIFEVDFSVTRNPPPEEPEEMK